MVTKDLAQKARRASRNLAQGRSTNRSESKVPYKPPSLSSAEKEGTLDCQERKKTRDGYLGTESAHRDQKKNSQGNQMGEHRGKKRIT